jgi:hypothetical protein
MTLLKTLQYDGEEGRRGEVGRGQGGGAAGMESTLSSPMLDV